MSQAQWQLDLQRTVELERRAGLWQRQYRLLLESLPEAVYTQDESGNLISTNSAGERLSGFTRQELLRMSVRQLLPEFHQSSTEMLEQASAGDQQFSAAAELLARDGSRRPVTVHASILCDPGWPMLVQYVVREAPSEKREEAGHAETRFRLMAKNLTEMVLAYDMDRRLTFANAGAETLTGYSASELERQQFICWIHPEDRERMLAHWDRLFQAKSFFEEEYRLITKDGRMKWVAASWGPILDDTGRQVGVQGRERDVTERRMAVATLRQSEHSLRINEERYRTLFESSPFPMWEEDFSRVKVYLDALADLEVTDLREYLSVHREALVECVRARPHPGRQPRGARLLPRAQQGGAARRSQCHFRRTRLRDFRGRDGHAGGKQLDVQVRISDSHGRRRRTHREHDRVAGADAQPGLVAGDRELLRYHRPQAPGRATAPVAEAGEPGAPGGRHRARLQQPPHRDQRL